MPFRCGLCDREFALIHQLRRHQNERKTLCTRAQGDSALDSTTCPHCNKEFSTKGNMRAHAKNSCKQRPRGGQPSPANIVMPSCPDIEAGSESKAYMLAMIMSSMAEFREAEEAGAAWVSEMKKALKLPERL